MENIKYDDKFYRLPKRLFKEEQFRSMTNEAKALYMILLIIHDSVHFVHFFNWNNSQENHTVLRQT